MSNADQQKTIEAAWEARDTVNAQTKGAVRDAVETALNLLDSVKIANLKLYVDPTAKANSPLKVFGMPTTILVDAQGREVGRLLGEAEWDSDEAKKLIKSILN